MGAGKPVTECWERCANSRSTNSCSPEKSERFVNATPVGFCWSPRPLHRTCTGRRGRRRGWSDLSLERESLHSALQWAFAENEIEVAAKTAGLLWPFWFSSDNLRAGATWLHRAYAHLDEVSGETRLSVICGSGFLSLTQARIRSRAGATRAAGRGGERGPASALYRLGGIRTGRDRTGPLESGSGAKALRIRARAVPPGARDARTRVGGASRTSVWS